MEFDPLLEPGFHDITIDSLESIFVQPFQNKERRLYLTERFKVLFEKFTELGIEAEIWIDGSYSTQKPEPGDIDLVFFYYPDQLNSLPEEKRVIVEELFDNKITKIRYNCDVYYAPTTEPEWRSYWRGWFGFSRDENPKGIPRLRYVIN